MITATDMMIDADTAMKKQSSLCHRMSPGYFEKTGNFANCSNNNAATLMQHLQRL
jgi:hypothetical protein